MPVSNWLRFTVAIDSVRPSRVGFGKPLIAAYDVNIPAVYQDVSELSELTAFGLSSTDPAYVAMAAMISQDNNRPSVIGLGGRTVEVAQIDTVTIVGFVDGTYTHTIADHDGVSTPFAYVSVAAASETDIRDGLIALIDADPKYGAVLAAADSYTVTAAVAGAAFTSTYTLAGGPVAGALTGATTTANNGAYEDLAAIRALNTSWYGITLTDHADHSIYEGSRYTEAQGSSDPMMLFGQTNSADVITNVVTDVAGTLNGLNRSRVAVTYHALDTEYVDSAIQGRCLPVDPGKVNWAWKKLNGITANSLTAAQVGYLKYYNDGGSNGKSCNYSESLGGYTTFMDGRTASGTYIELVRGADKLRADVLSDLITLYQTNDSVPFDEDGIELTANVMQAAAVRLSGRIGEPGLVSRDSIAITKPDLAAVSTTAFANGFLSGVTLTATIKGNINEVDGSATLTVSITT